MPTAIPDRYRLEMRLGKDDDVEEWLATDTSLDRPVLVRSLGPDSNRDRRRQFVESVGGAAKVSHPHLARVFAVAEANSGAYSVSEWTGGATLADRIGAGQSIELPDFLPNASGLAAALAALHDQGVVHGGVDLSAISYSPARPAKLGAFGRGPRSDAEGDVRALATALETALTGAPPGGPPPSERVDGVPRTIDLILRSAQTGGMTASELEKALLAAPTPRVPRPEPGASSARLLLLAGALIVLALGLVAFGRLFSGGSAPILPAPPVAGTTTTTVLTTTTTTEAGLVITNLVAHDPFGEGGENDDLIEGIIDGNAATRWQTESYEEPLASLKPGVGVVIAVDGVPSRLDLLGLSTGTVFDVYWSDTFFSEPDDWDRIATARAHPGTIRIDLPAREDGFWLLWLTDLPRNADGAHQAGLSEVRFSS